MPGVVALTPEADDRVDGASRRLAAVLMLAAGIVHLAQVGVHLDEGWHVAAFFVVVGVAQIGGGSALLKPAGRVLVLTAIAGNAAVIVVWILSRTTGLPLVEAGEPERIGVADALASLLEALVIAALVVYATARRGHALRVVPVIAAVVSLAVGLTWQLAAGRGVFDADDARLALDTPQLVDWLVAVLGGSAAAVLVGTGGGGTPAFARLRRGLFTLVGAMVVGGIFLTLPPTIGQNLDCAYAPLATVTGASHVDAPPTIPIAPGERRLLLVFELRACGRESVELLDARPLTVIGSGGLIGGFWLLPPGGQVGPTGIAQPPTDAQVVPPGSSLEPGVPRELAVEVRGVAGGRLELGSVRLTYRSASGHGSFGFATSISTCSADSCAERSRE